MTVSNHEELGVGPVEELIDVPLPISAEHDQDPPSLTDRQIEVFRISQFFPERFADSNKVAQKIAEAAGIPRQTIIVTESEPMNPSRTLFIVNRRVPIDEFVALPPSTTSDGVRTFGSRAIEWGKGATIVSVENRVGNHALQAIKLALEEK